MASRQAQSRQQAAAAQAAAAQAAAVRFRMQRGPPPTGTVPSAPAPAFVHGRGATAAGAPASGGGGGGAGPGGASYYAQAATATHSRHARGYAPQQQPQQQQRAQQGPQQGYTGAGGAGLARPAINAYRTGPTPQPRQGGNPGRVARPVTSAGHGPQAGGSAQGYGAPRQGVVRRASVGAAAQQHPASQPQQQETAPEHDFREMDLQVTQMTARGKFSKVAPYTPCSSTMPAPGRRTPDAAASRCACTGWKGHSIPNTVSGPEAPCLSCGHSLSDHGLLYSVPEEELTYRAQIVCRMESIYNAAHALQSEDLRQLEMDKVRHYRRLLAQVTAKHRAPIAAAAPYQVATAFSSPSQPERSQHPPPSNSLAGARISPYEVPSVMTMLQRYYLAVKARYERRSLDGILKLLTHFLNNNPMLPPDSHAQQYKKAIDPNVYNTQYVLWKNHKLGPRKSEKCMHVFGRSWLTCFFPHLCRSILQGLTKIAPELQDDMTRFLSLLQKEMYNPDSKLWEAGESSGSRKRSSSATDAAPPRKAARTHPGLPDASVKAGPAPAAPTPPPPTRPLPKLFGDNTAHYDDGPPPPVLGAEDHRLAYRAVSLTPEELKAKPMNEHGRESRARSEHASGIISFRIVANAIASRNSSGGVSRGPPAERELIYLSGLKTLFARALPNMPKEYITRTVFDCQHRTLALLKGNKVIGGICFRMFKPQDFMEIVFCAISSQEQVKGYGTYLMNHLKAYATRNACFHFLTYADNRAIGYFKKQGFTDKITLPKRQIHGYIKNYDGGTLMQCTLHAKITYHDLPSMFNAQRQTVKFEIKKHETRGTRRPGLRCFEAGETFIPLASIPGVLEAGWKEEMLIPEVKGPDKELQQWFRGVVRDLKAHGSSWPFHDPVSQQDVPDYYDVITSPMDLKTISTNIKHKRYSTKEAFFRDINLMLDNCRKYNDEDTSYYDLANQLQEYFRMRVA